MADFEANAAREMRNDVENDEAENVCRVSLEAVKALIGRVVIDPPPRHTRELQRFTAPQRWTGVGVLFLHLPHVWTERRPCF